MKVFVDTNILIDYVCRREPFFLHAKALFAFGYLGKSQIAVSALSIVNSIYIGRKYGSETLKLKLSALSHLIEVVDISATSVLQTLNTDWKDYEDALQYSSALSCGADCIITRNKKDFELSTLPVYTAEEYMNILDKE